jgi:glycosyltransferase involved in cell wall biosynthesis
VPGRLDYAQECRRAGEGCVTWLGRLDHDDPLLASAYAAARVFALPSWFETPGLAALEAALAGCAVVITPFGSTREYFGGLATYARPHRVDEIRRALRTCWDRGPDPWLAPRVATHYLWPNVAQITAEVYDQVAR